VKGSADSISPPLTLSDRLAQSVAAVTPITENPIPSWASESDSCNTKRSCDACTDSQYCKYTFSGKPQCCEAAKVATKKLSPLLQIIKGAAESMYSSE
jgi:hypothetical protein